MNVKATAWNPGAFRRHLILLPALVVMLSITFAGPASAQTTPEFQATVSGITLLPKPCATARLCGSATTSYGDAAWTFTPFNEAVISDTCGSYEATVTFTLADGSSTLVMDENGILCEPGQAFLAPGNALHSFGNPFYITGSWTVQSATGQFNSIAIGSGGTDTLHLAGAHASGAYAGTS